MLETRTIRHMAWREGHARCVMTLQLGPPGHSLARNISLSDDASYGSNQTLAVASGFISLR